MIWKTFLRNALSVTSELTTIFGFLYGFLWLNNFKKQKIIENHNADARKALDELINVQSAIDVFVSEKSDSKRNQALQNLPLYLKKLQNALFFLKECSGINDALNSVEKLTSCIRDNISDTQAVTMIIRENNWKNNLNLIQDVLLNIYKLDIYK